MSDETMKKMNDDNAASAEKEQADAAKMPVGSGKKKLHGIKKAIRRFSVWSWLVVAVVGFFAVIGIVAVGYATLHGLKDDSDASRFSRGSGDYNLRDDQTGGNSTMRGGMMEGNRGGFGMMGGDTSVSSSTRVSGVVTGVDGDIITVAGNGTTVSVKVTDSTKYTGSSKPAAANDTITAFGTTDDGVLTATSVRLVRQ